MGRKSITKAVFVSLALCLAWWSIHRYFSWIWRQMNTWETTKETFNGTEWVGYDFVSQTARICIPDSHLPAVWPWKSEFTSLGPSMNRERPIPYLYFLTGLLWGVHQSVQAWGKCSKNYSHPVWQLWSSAQSSEKRGMNVSWGRQERPTERRPFEQGEVDVKGSLERSSGAVVLN